MTSLDACRYSILEYSKVVHCFSQFLYFVLTTNSITIDNKQIVKLNLQLPVESVHIATNVVRLNLAHVEVYSIQHYVIKFVSDLRQVGGLLRILWFPPPIKLTSTK